MRRRTALRLVLGALVGCASADVEIAPVPLCAPLDTLAPLPDSCPPGELDAFSERLSREIEPHASTALVRVELDDAAGVSAVCVEPGPGHGPLHARRALAEKLDAIRSSPSGPACVAGRRLDLNRYEAMWERIREREMRCGRDPRPFDRCMGDWANRDDWIVLEAPGSHRPVLFVKPQVPDPPGPSATQTSTYCLRKSRISGKRGFEKRAACIESEGWERLDPPGY